MARLHEAFAAAADLADDREPEEPSPNFLDAFPPASGDDIWSGFLAIFDESDFPTLGADLTGGPFEENPALSIVQISGATDFQPWPIAQIIRRCCQHSLSLAPIGFE